MSIRVAVVQLAIDLDREQNLQHCVAKIAQAAGFGAQVIVLPEFSNYPGFWIEQEGAWHHAEALDGPFLQGIGGAAKEHGAYVCVGVSLRGIAEPQVWGSQLLYSPDGELIGRHDKEVLLGQQNDHLSPGLKPAEVVDTPLGRLAMYASTEGLLPETARVAALAGAQLLLCSLESCFLDDGELHVPVRAAENHVWIAAANKACYDAPQAGTVHAGRSQIVDPKGHVRARANGDGREEIVYADVELELAGEKVANAGCHLIDDRQPGAYGLLTRASYDLPFYQEKREALGKPLPARLAVIQTARLLDARHLLDEEGANIVVLPERLDASLSDVSNLAEKLECYLATSLMDADEHVGVLIGPRGELALRYKPVHPRPGSGQTPGDGFQVLDTVYGRIGMMVGCDGLFPESARVLACMGADVIVYPTTWTEEWEPKLGVHERAAENHVSLLAAARLDSPIEAGSILIAAQRRTVGHGSNVVLNRFAALEAPAGVLHQLVTVADVAAARDKTVLNHTDVLAHRRAEHCASLAPSGGAPRPSH